MHRFSPAARAIGHVVFRFRDYLGPLALMIVLASSRASDFVVGTPSSWLTAIAVGLLVGGLAIRVGVAGYGVVRRAGVRKRISASRLLTDGLYAHTRNPLYLANMMLLGGLAAIYGSLPVLLIAMPILLLVIAAIVRAEEEFLAERFGAAYARYRRRVGRFAPRLQGLTATLAALPFDARRAIRREYGTVFAVVSTALVLMARRHLALDGFRAARASLSEIAAIWAACAVAWAFVRWMKKAKRLETPVEDLPQVVWPRDQWG